MSEVVAMNGETRTVVQDTKVQESDAASAVAADWEAAWTVYLATGRTVASAFDEDLNWPDTMPISVADPEEATAQKVTTEDRVTNTAPANADEALETADRQPTSGPPEETPIVTATAPTQETAAININQDGKTSVQKLAQSFQTLAVQSTGQKHTSNNHTGQDHAVDVIPEEAQKIPPFMFKVEKSKQGGAVKQKKQAVTVSGPELVQALESDASTVHSRKLVTVRTITSIKPVARVPNMNVATVDGWEVVFDQAKRFQVGKPVVFFEIDSFLPASNRLFAQLNQSRFGEMRGHLVSPIKYNKQISQGLIYHLADFPEIRADRKNWYADCLPGYPPASRKDYAAELGVVKFCLEGVKAAEQIGPFPSWIQKADMDRVQNIHKIFAHTKYGDPKMQFQESVKMDGQTMTCYYIRDDAQIYKSLPEITRDDDDDDDACLSFCDSGRFGVCTRTCDRRYLPNSLYWQAALHYGLRDKLAKLGKNIAIQGELVGSTIEGNPHAYADGEHEFFIFSIYDVDTHERWDPREVEKFAEDMGLKHVPVRGYFTLFDVGKSVADMLARACAQEFEGLVYKSVFDGRWFKVISPDWLMRRQAQQIAGKKKGDAKL